MAKAKILAGVNHLNFPALSILINSCRLKKHYQENATGLLKTLLLNP